MRSTARPQGRSRATAHAAVDVWPSRNYLRGRAGALGVTSTPTLLSHPPLLAADTDE